MTVSCKNVKFLVALVLSCITWEFAFWKWKLTRQIYAGSARVGYCWTPDDALTRFPFAACSSMWGRSLYFSSFIASETWQFFNLIFCLWNFNLCGTGTSRLSHLNHSMKYWLTISYIFSGQGGLASCCWSEEAVTRQLCCLRI